MTYKRISELYNVSKPGICHIMKRFRQRKTIESKPRSGRPKVTTEKADRLLVRFCKNNPLMTAVELNSIMHQFHGTNCSIDTTKRRLRQNNLYGCRPVKKPLISARNLRTRIKFARDHLSWTVNDWSKVLFSDESKFRLFSSDGVRYVRRPIGDRFNPKYQLPTVKHGRGNGMVWGCFSHDNLGPIHCIEGIMDQRVYLDIMKSIMLPHAKCIAIGSFNKIMTQSIVPDLLRNIFNQKKSTSLNGLHRAQISIPLSIFGSTLKGN